MSLREFSCRRDDSFAGRLAIPFGHKDCCLSSARDAGWTHVLLLFLTNIDKRQVSPGLVAEPTLRNWTTGVGVTERFF